MIDSFGEYDKINESDFFDNEESVNKYIQYNNLETKPKFKIGDIVYHIDEDLKIYDSTPNCEYTSEMLNNAKAYTGLPLKIIGKFKGKSGSDYPWWSNVQYTIGNHTDSMFIIDDALSYHKTKEPNYKPKRIERTFESNNDKDTAHEFFILINNVEELRIIVNLLKPHGYTEPAFMIDGEYPMYVFINMKFKMINYATIDGMKPIFISGLSNTYGFNGCWDKMLTFKDLDLIKLIIKNQKISIVPDYKPRKIVRESNDFKYRYDQIFICADSRYENVTIQKEIFKCGFKWNSQIYYSRASLMYGDSSEIVFWLNLEKKSIAKFDNRTTFEVFASINNDFFSNPDPRLYEYSDLKYVTDNILSVKPTYKPRKIDRSFESNTWYPYRFKTIDEFIKDYGRSHWRSANHNNTIGFIEQMDYLLGQVYPFDININDYGFQVDLPNLPCSTDIIPRGYWTIRKFMLTPNDKIPNYKPRKIERTLESFEDSKFTSVVFSINNDQECKIVQEELIKRDYSWEVSGEEHIVRYFQNEYPIYLFAEIDNDRISYMGGSDTNRYYGGIESYITNCNDDGENICTIIFKFDDIRYFDTIMKNGKIEPNYKPRKIERTFESVKKYKYICIEANNENEMVTVQKELFKNGYRWTISGQEIKYINREHIIICTELYGKNMGYLDDEIEFNERKENLNMYDKIFKYNELNNYILFLKNGTEQPSYKPKRIERTFEARNDNKSAREIFIKLNDKSDVNILKDILTEIDYTIPSFIKNNQTPIFYFPIYIFIDFIDRDIMYITKPEKPFDFERETMFDGVWSKQLTMNDSETIKYILVNKKIMDIPSYRPKKIIRESKVFESFNDRYPYQTIILTIKNVDELIELKNYFFNRFNKEISPSNRNTMTSYLNRSPLYVRCMYDNRNNELLYFYGSINNLHNNVYRDEYEKLFDINDIKRDVISLIINTGSSNNVPSYKPKKIDRTLENYQFINDNNELDNCKYPKPNFRIGDKVIFKPDAIEIYESRRRHYEIDPLKLKLIESYIFKKKEMVIEDMAFEDNKKYWLMCLEDDNYYYDDMLDYNRPSYKPRKINRTL